MKRIALFVTILLLVACQKDQKGYTITADTAGFKDGTVVYVNAISQSNRPIIIDSVSIQQDQFQITLPPPESKDFNYLTFKDIRGNVLFMAENNPIEMTIYKDSLRSSVIKGGSENELFFSYVNTVKRYGEEKLNLNNQYQIASKLGETDKVVKISLERQELIEKEKQFRKGITDNTNSLVSIIAITELLNLKLLTAQEAKLKFDQIDDTLKPTRLGKNLNMLINNVVSASKQKKIDIGVTAEDFSAPTPEGKMLSLKESMGKITIIDFWASWCKPCRMENPNVVKVYNKYHDKGLNIIGVSLDKKTSSLDQSYCR